MWLYGGELLSNITYHSILNSLYLLPQPFLQSFYFDPLVKESPNFPTDQLRIDFRAHHHEAYTKYAPGIY